MKQYTVIYEKGSEGQEAWGAYVPDLPVCVTTGSTFEEAERNIREAIELHLEGLEADGIPAPEPVTRAGVVQIAA